MQTIDHILCAHGYVEGPDTDRLLKVFKDLAYVKAKLAAYEMSAPPGVRRSVDALMSDLSR